MCANLALLSHHWANCSTSRTLNHRSADGKHIPTLRAEEAELTAIAHAMRDTGIGWMQIVSDFQDQAGEIGRYCRTSEHEAGEDRQEPPKKTL